MSELRIWTLAYDYNFDNHPPLVISGPEVTPQEDKVKVIEYIAYEKLKTALERIALIEVYRESPDDVFNIVRAVLKNETVSRE